MNHFTSETWNAVLVYCSFKQISKDWEMLEHSYEVNWKDIGYLTVPFLDCILCNSSIQVSKGYFAAGKDFDTQLRLLKSEHELQALTEEVKRLKELIESIVAKTAPE